jgi:Flp pilus assembly protein TadD
VYAAFILVVVVYYVTPPIKRSGWNKERLFRQMFVGERQERATAAAGLVAVGAQEELLRALRSDSDTTRELAANALTDLWFNAAGDDAYEHLQTSLQAIDQHEFKEAMFVVNRLVQKYPFFAEGWHVRANLFWRLGQIDRTMADCKKVVLLNPNHFLAWQCMGLCQMQTGDLENARRSLRAAQQLSPFDPALNQYVRRCEEMQRRFRPGFKRGVDTV